MSVYFAVQVDWDNDGSFATSGDDITTYVMDVNVQGGIQDAFQRVAQVGRAQIRVKNADKRFSPSHASGAYYGKLLPNRPVRIQVTNGSTTWTIFRGVARRYAPASGEYGQRDAVIECEDLLGVLQAYNIAIPLQTDKAGGYLLKLITSAAFRSAKASGSITFSGQPSDADTVTVNGVAYRFKNTLAQANDVKIGTTVEDTVDNLVAAIVGKEGSGTKYYAGTTRPDGVSAKARMTYYREVQKSKATRYYRLGEPSGTNAEDVGENGRDGTYVDTPTLGVAGALSGDSDTAVTFNGTSEYVSVPTMNIANTAFSVEFWIKPSATTPPTYQTPLSISDGYTGYNSIRFIVVDTGILSANAVSDQIGTNTGVITFGSWNHCVYTYTSADGNGRLYVNGALEQDDGMSAHSGAAPVITIGADPALGEWVKGDMDEVALYLRALTADEVTAHYAARSITRGVTIEANARGAWGNDITLAKSGTNITVSGANLTGGADGPTGLISYMDGRRTFDIAGDKWSAGETNALQAAQDVVQSEYGMFWQARNGTLTFKDNLYEFAQTSVAASLTLSSQHNAIENAVAKDEVYNRVVVSYQPRGTLSSGVIAKARDVIQVPGKWGEDRTNPADDLPAGGQITVKVPYVDQGTGEFSGAQSLTLPLEPGTDYTVNDQEDGGGFDYTNNANIQVTAAINGSDVEVSFVNTALGSLYVHDLQVRGTGIISYDPTQVIADDSDSQDAYGRNTLSLGLPLPTSNAQNFAQSLAEYLLSRHKDPAHRISAIAFRGQTVIGSTNIFSLEIGDVITVTDAQVGISAQKYMITGVRYRVSNGNPAATDVVFAVRRLDDVTYWILENATYGVLGTTTRLAL